MVSPFAAEVSIGEAVLDDELAERINLTPMLGGASRGYTHAQDLTRASIDFVALVDYTDPMSADISTLDARVSYQQLEMQVRRSALPSGTVFRKGDIVQLLDRPGVPRNKISDVNFDDPDRLIVVLAPISDEAA